MRVADAVFAGLEMPIDSSDTNSTGDQCGAAVLITKPFARVLVPDVPVRLSAPGAVGREKPPSSNARAKVVGRSTTRLRTAGVAVPSLVAVAPVPPRAAALRAGGAVAGEQLDARRRRRRGIACVIWSLSRLRSGRNGSRRQRAYRECRRGKCPDNFSHRNLIPRSVWNYGTYYHSPVWSAGRGESAIAKKFPGN